MKLLMVAFLCVIFFGGIGLLCSTWAVISIARGEFLTGIVVLGFAMFSFGLVVPFVKVLPQKIIARGAFDAAGTTIWPDRGIDIPVQLSLVGLVVAMALFATFAPLGELDIPTPHTMRYYLPFISAAGAVAGAPIVWRNFKRGATKYLRLTPKGFEIAQGWSPSRGEWEQIEDVTDKVPGQATPAESAVVIVMADGHATTLAAGSFTPNGRALRQLVRFYWQHPDRRGELTDGRALERLRNEDFKVSR
ncbi:hypothetical protein [Mycobacterium celatum]|uniref:Uncharacterized protein n=1 Tax=Mycobacterium celatum TaxID=28045 RepID=A0A1X1RH59_MYCCE|nr:hypothetical protein [Mycobacterium celatum]ORV05625.1 hypothetical protein AWB95_00215 [Mycobacterium celatum]PIB74468.1 hypothetical protein CQY23_21350 [Mycobacterium celatum]